MLVRISAAGKFSILIRRRFELSDIRYADPIAKRVASGNLALARWSILISFAFLPGPYSLKNVFDLGQLSVRCRKTKTNEV